MNFIALLIIIIHINVLVYDIDLYIGIIEHTCCAYSFRHPALTTLIISIILSSY